MTARRRYIAWRLGVQPGKAYERNIDGETSAFPRTESADNAARPMGGVFLAGATFTVFLLIPGHRKYLFFVNWIARVRADCHSKSPPFWVGGD